MSSNVAKISQMRKCDIFRNMGVGEIKMLSFLNEIRKSLQISDYVFAIDWRCFWEKGKLLTIILSTGAVIKVRCIFKIEVIFFTKKCQFFDFSPTFMANLRIKTSWECSLSLEQCIWFIKLLKCTFWVDLHDLLTFQVFPLLRDPKKPFDGL